MVLTYFVFFSPDLSGNDAIILSSNSNKRVVYIIENDNMCEKLSPVLVFLYVLIYDTILRQPARCVIILYIKLMQKGCNNLSTKKIYVYNFYLNIFRYITLYYIRRTVNDWYKNLYTQLFLITHINFVVHPRKNRKLCI